MPTMLHGAGLTSGNLANGMAAAGKGPRAAGTGSTTEGSRTTFIAGSLWESPLTHHGPGPYNICHCQYCRFVVVVAVDVVKFVLLMLLIVLL